MKTLLTVLYWALATPTGLGAAALVFTAMGGKRITPITPVWLTFVTGLGIGGLLVWSYRLSSIQGRPGWGCVVTVASWILFAVVMTAWGLSRQKTWQ